MKKMILLGALVIATGIVAATSQKTKVALAKNAIELKQCSYCMSETEKTDPTMCPIHGYRN